MIEMPENLPDILRSPESKRQLVTDCLGLLDHQVAGKGGVSGMALKGAYRVVKGIGADYLPGVVERLLPDVLVALNPLWVEGAATGDPIAHLGQQRDRAADILLGITDRKAAGTHGAVRSVYQKLRRSIHPDVAAAVPSVATLLSKYATPQKPIAG